MSLRSARFFGLLVALPLAACGGGGAYKTAASAPPSYGGGSAPGGTYGGVSTNGVPGSYAARSAPAGAPMAASEERLATKTSQSYGETVVVAESSGDSDSGSSTKAPSGPQPLPPPRPKDDVGTSDGDGVTNAATTGNTNVNPQPGTTQAPSQPKEMLDIEANMTVAVDSVRDAAKRVRDLAKEYGANVTGDQVQDEGSYQRGAFEIRVPSEKIDAFLEAISGVGTVRSRDVRATDVSKQYFDSQILLRNLEVTMKRYEEILAQAKNVQEVLVVEQELTRLRGEINRVKGELRFMRDRVSRSTLHLQLVPKSVDTSPPPEVPEAKLFPGVRGTMLTDLTGDGNKTYYGLGLSIFFLRSFQVDFDVLRHGDSVFASNGSSGRAFLVTAGGDIYSDFFGGGRRAFLNPYVGLRGGYARIDGKNNALVSGTLGLELFRSKGVLLDLQARLHLFFGNGDGAHAGIQPTLGLNVAF
jgi:hypothetical protein